MLRIWFLYKNVPATEKPKKKRKTCKIVNILILFITTGFVIFYREIFFYLFVDRLGWFILNLHTTRASVYSKLFRNPSFSSVLHHGRRLARAKRFMSGVYVCIYNVKTSCVGFIEYRC